MSIRTVFLTRIARVLVSSRNHYHNPRILTSQFRPNLNSSVIKWYSNKPVKCWQCGIERKNIGELFCEQCKYIQSPPDKNNYFKVFELDEKFDIDQKQLTRKYRQMQSLLHPDKFTNKSDEEKNISENYSSLVNKAYGTLQAPLKRALHLLSLRGEEIEEGQKVDDPEFLMEIMELNEEVESADNAEKLKSLRQKNDAQLTKIAKEIESHFDTDQTAKAKEAIIKMKYYNSVNVYINNLMREGGVVD